MRSLVWISRAIFLTGAAGAAASWQSTDLIAETAEMFVERQLGEAASTARVTAQPVDARLKLRACDAPLEAFLPAGARLTATPSIGVRCPGSTAWKLYVPVRIEQRAEVARLRRALPPGHTIGAADFEWVDHPLTTGSMMLQKSLQNPVGRVLRTACGAGQLLQASMLQPDYAVRRGERVTLATRRAGLAIRMVGEALTDGARGQKIRARNLSSGRVVEGIVRDRGLLEIVVY